MNRRTLVYGAIITGACSTATGVVLDLTGLLHYALWEIALSFPLGVLMFLLLELVTGWRPRRGR